MRSPPRQPTTFGHAHPGTASTVHISPGSPPAFPLALVRTIADLSCSPANPIPPLAGPPFRDSFPAFIAQPTPFCPALFYCSTLLLEAYLAPMANRPVRVTAVIPTL